MSIDYKLVQSLFQQLVELPQEQRAAALDAACGDQEEIRQRVATLLEMHEETDSLLDHTKGPLERALLSHPADEPSSVEPGTTIGDRYTLRRKIGEGGMGDVWVAQQLRPIEREVALKLIKPGMDSKSVAARFEQERQALAVMDHPHIARVLDGGVTDSGRPYFVMELVDGAPIGEFCDSAKLGLAERLALFDPICRAVEHAHQKGIVHRDLKPSNILVTVVDGKPVPKVIDFGVAKAVGDKLTDQTMVTELGVMVGTLEYMAPEQAGVSGEDIDTRADIYSLGVILYELLTGLRPHDGKRLRAAALGEVIRILRDEEPSKPSARLSTAEARQTLAEFRNTESRRLMAQLRGELDWIVMKCLEKDRNRRYATATGLSRDIARFLGNQPVEARPPSTGYLLVKFLKRNKLPAMATAAILLTLLGGIAGTSWGLIEARQQATQKARRAEGERLAKEQAEARLQQVEKANGILFSIFANLDPDEIALQELPLQAILAAHLDEAIEQLDGEAVGDPLAVARMQVQLGNSLVGLGEPLKASVPMKKALETFRRELGPHHGQTLTTQNDVAWALHASGQTDEALTMMRQAHELVLAHLAGDHRLVGIVTNNLANIYMKVGKSELALPLFEGLLQKLEPASDLDHPFKLEVMTNLAAAHTGIGNTSEALAILLRTRDLKLAKYGSEHPSTLHTMGRLASAYEKAGDLQRAVELHESTYQLRKKHLGDRHPSTIYSLSSLGSVHLVMGNKEQAVQVFEHTLELTRARFGNEHVETVSAMRLLVQAYVATDELEKASSLSEEAETLAAAIAGSARAELEGGALNAEYLRNLATAEERYREALAREGPRAIVTLLARRDLAQRYMAHGDFDKAEETLIQIIGAMDKDIDEPILLFTIRLFYECVRRRQQSMPDAWLTFDRQSVLGEMAFRVKDVELAEQSLEEGYRGLAEREQQIPAERRGCITTALKRLVQFYEQMGRTEEAEVWKAKLSAVERKR